VETLFQANVRGYSAPVLDAVLRDVKMAPEYPASLSPREWTRRATRYALTHAVPTTGWPSAGSVRAIQGMLPLVLAATSSR